MPAEHADRDDRTLYGQPLGRRSALLAGLAFASPVLWRAAPAMAAEPIRIGMPIGLSGANSVVAPSVVQAAQLAIAEINAKGGVLGRPLELMVADDGSGADGAVKAFNALLFQQKADVIITMETSAARNGGLPVISRARTPFIYTSSYEGRSCNPYLFCNGWVPEQQVPPMIDYFRTEKSARNFFLVGSDYAFGRGMLGFTRRHIEANGGTVVGEEYLPMDATDWTSVLSKLRSAKPDALISSTAGGAPNVTLTKQLRASGIDVLFGNLGVDEGTAQSIGADSVGVYMSQSYLTGLDNPENEAFKAGLRRMFGAETRTPNDLSVPQYDGVYLYKAAIERAGSPDKAKVVEALSQVSFKGPRGVIQMNRQRHAPLTMYLGQMQADLGIRVIKVFENVDPGEQCPKLG